MALIVLGLAMFWLAMVLVVWACCRMSALCSVDEPFDPASGLR